MMQEIEQAVNALLITNNNRAQIIKHLNGFIKISVGEHKIFWLRVRYKIEHSNEITINQLKKG